MINQRLLGASGLCLITRCNEAVAYLFISSSCVLVPTYQTCSGHEMIYIYNFVNYYSDCIPIDSCSAHQLRYRQGGVLFMLTAILRHKHGGIQPSFWYKRYFIHEGMI